MSGVIMLHFLKDWWKFIQIYQYYTMALINTNSINVKTLFSWLLIDPSEHHYTTPDIKAEKNLFLIEHPQFYTMF